MNNKTDAENKQIFATSVAKEIKDRFDESLSTAGNRQIYEATAAVVQQMLTEKFHLFQHACAESGQKKVYYLCMEFLPGKSLKNNLCNLGLYNIYRDVLKENNVQIDDILDIESDAGLGNGGLGRLASCFMDAFATGAYPAGGYSICYEYGIFKQKINDGWQEEVADNWLRTGAVWLRRKDASGVDVPLGGSIHEFWENGIHHTKYENYTTVRAVPYDMLVSGFDSQGVSRLRLWRAEYRNFDMEKFNSGDYSGALAEKDINESISRVLYPNDNHEKGKELRLRQQYFLVCASLSDIVRHHLKKYPSLDNFAEKTAIHINDTHPAMAIAELMRVLMDDCGYGWDAAWEITQKTFSYTNHTVMAEALECWDKGLMQRVVPRIFQIIEEINRRHIQLLNQTCPDYNKIAPLNIIPDNRVKMASLCVLGSHTVNGVSAIHSDIIKKDVFSAFYQRFPGKFTNVTNGIAHRRWLYQSNPRLYKLASELTGEDINKNPQALERLMAYKEDTSVLEQIGKIKAQNKIDFSNYVKRNFGESIDPSFLLDVQVKRLHEYKRQHLNALHILKLYLQLKENPNMDFQPQCFIFGAKAAPGYYLAKNIIKFICSLAKQIDFDKDVNHKLKVVFLENYNVSLTEHLMPAAEVSEQISLAGTEASGTGNMKLMLNGAITLGTLDGANVEIGERVGSENIITFGLKTPEVNQLLARGYRPQEFIQNSQSLQRVLEELNGSIGGENFNQLYSALVSCDRYLALADFEAYCAAQEKMKKLYADKNRWNQMSLINTAQAGFFSADRTIEQYASEIWHIEKVK